MTRLRLAALCWALVLLVLIVGNAVAQQVRVVDGDTIVVDGERVRIYGLDCPERRDPGGPLATRTLAKMLDGAAIDLKRRGQDRYGRTVAKVFADGRDVTCQMIRAGVCREYVRYSRGEYEGCR